MAVRAGSEADMQIRLESGRIIPATLTRPDEEGAADRLIIMLHGLTGSRNEAGGLFRRLAPHLAAGAGGADVLRIDLAGHGDSAMPFDQVRTGDWVMDLLSTLAWAGARYNAVDLVALSMGAAVSILATRHADLAAMKLARAVFLSPCTSFETGFFNARGPYIRDSGFPQGADGNLAGFEKPLPMSADGRFVLTPELYRDMAENRPETVTWPDDIALSVIHGDADDAISIQDSEDFVARHEAGTVKLVRIDGAGHLFEAHEAILFQAMTDILS